MTGDGTAPPAGPAAGRTDGGPDVERPLWRNPWAWGLALGLLFVTVMTPRTRYVPEPPRSVGALPTEVWVDETGAAITPWASARAVVMAFAGEGVEGCPDPLPIVRKLQISFAQTEIPLEIVLAAVVGEGGDVAKRTAAVEHALGGARPGIRIIGVTDAAAVSSMLIGSGADVGTCDAAGLPRVLTIADGTGRARGVYRVTSEESVSEIYHRSQHVSLEGRERGSNRTE